MQTGHRIMQWASALVQGHVLQLNCIQQALGVPVPYSLAYVCKAGLSSMDVLKIKKYNYMETITCPSWLGFERERNRGNYHINN
jgi:hypothetical protein